MNLALEKIRPSYSVCSSAAVSKTCPAQNSTPEDTLNTKCPHSQAIAGHVLLGTKQTSEVARETGSLIRQEKTFGHNEEEEREAHVNSAKVAKLSGEIELAPVHSQFTGDAFLL